MWIVGAVLHRYGYISSPLTSLDVGEFFGGTVRGDDPSLGSFLVRRLLLQLSHRGTDVRTLRRRLVSGQNPMQIGCWWWQWKA
eukprot:6490184-Amphidinium_carterae.1